MNRYFTTARVLLNADMKQQLDQALLKFKEKLKSVKSGSTSLDKYTTLQVDTGDATVRLDSIGTVVQRGNKINIVAYDPKQVKRIQTAFIKELGLTAVTNAQNNQMLTIPVPSLSSSAVNEQKAQAKALYDNFKNNKKNHQSLSSIRAKFLQPIKKQQLDPHANKNATKKEAEKIEKLAQDYSAKFKDAFTAF